MSLNRKLDKRLQGAIKLSGTPEKLKLKNREFRREARMQERVLP